MEFILLLVHRDRDLPTNTLNVFKTYFLLISLNLKKFEINLESFMCKIWMLVIQGWISYVTMDIFILKGRRAIFHAWTHTCYRFYFIFSSVYTFLVQVFQTPRMFHFSRSLFPILIYFLHFCWNCFFNKIVLIDDNGVEFFVCKKCYVMSKQTKK